jgi:TonB family protein
MREFSQIIRTVCVTGILLTWAIRTAAEEAPSRARMAEPLTEQELADSYPPAALATGTSGRAVLNCTVGIDGTASCDIAEESPSNFGFGHAAETLIESHVFTPATENGVPIGAHVRMPIAFQITPEHAVVGAEIYVDGQNRGNEYPYAAREAHVEGRVLVACVARSTGQRDCAVEAESLEGWGFGEAALRRVLGDAETQSSRSVIRIPVTYSFERPYRRRWERRPTARDIAQAYPDEALRSSQSGSVVLLCVILPDRTLDCRVDREAPNHQGFAIAALRVARAFKLSEDQLGQPGLTIGDTLTIPINFRTG